MILVLIFVLSLLPSIFFYFWLKKRKEDKEYESICISTLKRGLFLSTLLALSFSSALFILEILFKSIGTSDMFITAFHNYILLALSEEVAKYLIFKKTIKKYSYSYSYLDYVSLMMIIGLGFGLVESFTYAIGGNAGTMITRGVTLMHCGYGFVMGFFYSKSLKTSNKIYRILTIFIPFIIHGSYDFCLSDYLTKISECSGYIALLFALISIIINIIAIVFIKKKKNDDEYNRPLI